MTKLLVLLLLAACGDNIQPPDAPVPAPVDCQMLGKTSVCTDRLGPRYTELVCPLDPLPEGCTRPFGDSTVCCTVID